MPDGYFSELLEPLPGRLSASERLKDQQGLGWHGSEAISAPASPTLARAGLFATTLAQEAPLLDLATFGYLGGFGNIARQAGFNGRLDDAAEIELLLEAAAPFAGIPARGAVRRMIAPVLQMMRTEEE